MSDRPGDVVMLSYYFPPLIGIASERAAASFRHLPAFGWQPTAIVPRNGHFHRLNESDASPDQNVISTANPELSRLLRRMYAPASADAEGLVEPVKAGSMGRALRKLVREGAYVPDAQVGWIPFATRAALKAVRDQKRTHQRVVLLSSSVPYSSHLAASWVARRTGVPWVAEFRDPWTTGTVGSRPSKPRQRVNLHLHEGMLRRAAHVVYTSESTRAAVLAQFPWLDANKTSVVRNGFEPGEPARVPTADEKFVLTYTGTVGDDVDIRPCVRALADEAASSADGFVLRVWGPPDAWRAAALAETGQENPAWLELRGLTSPAAARRAMSEASANLIIVFGDAYFGSVPGKLYECLGARRPVLAIVPAGSEMAALAAQYGDARLVHSNDAASICQPLAQLLAEHRAGQLAATPADDGSLVQLTRREQTRLLAQVLDSVASA